jgi:allophanate hydrolase subunit 2
VQVANPGYALTISRAGRDRLTAHGIDPDGLLDRMATADLVNRLQLVEMVARYYWGNEL